MRTRAFSMVAALMLPFLAAPWTDCLHGQVTWLSVREAMSIAGRIPDVAAAEKDGGCPNFSVGYSGAEEFTFQVRYACGPRGGMLIDNYTVNRKTGKTSMWGDNPTPVLDQAGEVFARQLIIQAQKRILSPREARCLAFEAAKSLPGWSESKGSILVKEISKDEYGQVDFIAEFRSSVRSSESGQVLTVDPTTGCVRDSATGLNLMSEGLGSLTGKLLALRVPAWLSSEDAIAVAMAIPSVSGRLQDGCILTTGGVFRPEEAIIGKSCGDRRQDGWAISVNLKTGQVKDANSGKPVESADAIRVARQLLDRIEQQRSSLQKEIEATCPP